jgi:hypothetical protein
MSRKVALTKVFARTTSRGVAPLLADARGSLSRRGPMLLRLRHWFFFALSR